MSTLARSTTNAALPVSIAVMDACWLFTATWLFQNVILTNLRTFYVPHPATLAVLEAAAWWLADRALYSRWGNAGLGAAGLLGMPVALGVMLALNPTVDGPFSLQWLLKAGFGAVVLLGAWILGIWHATQDISFSTAFNTFLAGMGAIALVVLISSIVAPHQSATAAPALDIVPPLFFIAALTGLAMGNRDLLRREVGSPGGSYWIMAVAGSIVGVLLISLLGGVFQVNRSIQAVLGAIGWVIQAIGIIIFWIAFFIINFLISIFPIHLSPIQGPPLPAPTPQGTPVGAPGTGIFKTPDIKPGVPFDVASWSTWIAIILVVAALLAVLIYFGRKIRPRTRRKAVAEERENFGSWKLLNTQLANWWQLLRARLGSNQPALSSEGEDDLAALRNNPEWSGTLTIRQIYAQLQTLAAGLGYPRAAHQTPIEYFAVLSTAMPQLRYEFSDITQSYLEARYGPLPATAPAVLLANNAWKRTQRALGEF